MNEEDNRFIKACFLAQRDKTRVTIFKDKWFDFMYEDDFIRVVRHYLTTPVSDLKKTINLSYQTKYRLSDIAKMLVDHDRIDIVDPITSHNYCGNGDQLNEIGLTLDGLEVSIQKYLARIN